MDRGHAVGTTENTLQLTNLVLLVSALQSFSLQRPFKIVHSAATLKIYSIDFHDEIRAVSL